MQGPTALLGSQAWLAINDAKLLGLLTQSPEDWFKGRTLHLSLADGLKISDQPDADVIRGEKYIEERIAARSEAKARRDFAEADRIREELKAEGVLLEDGPGGTTWRRA